MKYPIKLKYALAMALILTGCAGGPVRNIPKSEADFSLPPQELRNKYTSIDWYAKGNVLEGPSLKMLTQAWGDPIAVRKDRRRIEAMAVASAFALPLIMVSPAEGLMFGGLAAPMEYLISPYKRVHVWRKGDYQIEAATFAENLEHPITEWNWKHRQREEYVSLIPERPDSGFMYGIDFSYGKGVTTNSPSNSDSSITFGILLSLGYNFDKAFRGMDVETSLSYASLPLSGSVWGNGLRQVLASVGVMKPIPNFQRARVGMGIIYPLNSGSLVSKDQKAKLSPNIGASLQADYLMDLQHMRIGYRVFYLEQPIKSGGFLQNKRLNIYISKSF